MSLYLEKKKFGAFPASPFNTFSYFLADVSRGQGSEAGGESLGSYPADQPRQGTSWKRKASSKQVPMALRGDREDNQAVEDTARSQAACHGRTIKLPPHELQHLLVPSKVA